MCKHPNIRITDYIIWMNINRDAIADILVRYPLFRTLVNYDLLSLRNLCWKYCFMKISSNMQIYGLTVELAHHMHDKWPVIQRLPICSSWFIRLSRPGGCASRLAISRVCWRRSHFTRNHYMWPKAMLSGPRGNGFFFTLMTILLVAIIVISNHV